jgi:hypothetical protein
VHQLEVLLLLRRYADREWFAREVGRELYTHSISAADEMDRLCKMGFAVRSAEQPEPKWRYQAQSEEYDQLVNELAETYRMYRLKVIDAIFAIPQDSIRQFSDAFRIRSEEDQK